MKSSLKFIGLLAGSAALILILTLSNTPISDNKTPQLIAKANLYNLQFPQEKVYLHFDRSSYWASDDIWFKAYLKDSPNPHSNLYVELLNSSGTVIQKKIYRSQSGMANGDFHLSDTITTGVYQVRAYTNWMRNFDDGWFFRKNLVIWNFKGKKIAQDSRQLKERNIDCQFFPEGGTFVTNLKTRMAFKVTDENGKGLDVKGRIVDDQGKEIATVKSDFKGMGHFLIQPLEGRKYLAELIIAGGVDMNVDLPVPDISGVTLSIEPNQKEQLHIQVAEQANGLESNHNYILIASTKGSVLFNKEIKTDKGSFDLDLEIKDYPTGIVQFTLFDNELVPRCERLVFVNSHDFINVNIEPDKSVYRIGEKAQFYLESFNNEGDPCLANLSMSVYHSDNQLKTEDYPNNILSQFLLSSELKGLVEEPAYYFKDDSLSTLKALDNLMLTHGYCHFEWNQIQEDKVPKIVYQAESGIKIKGTIKTSLTQNPVPNGTVNLMFMNDTLKTYKAVTDSSGYFVFKDFNIKDTVAVFLEARTSKGKKSTWIELDKRSNESPAVKSLPTNYQYLDDRKVNVTASFDQVSLSKINRKWKLSDTIMINEFQVVKSKYKFGKRPMRLYEKADYECDLNTDDDELGNVFHKVENKFHDVIVDVREETEFIKANSELNGSSDEPDFPKPRPTVRVDYQKGDPIYVLDGKVVNKTLIDVIPAGAFKRVEILKNGSVYGNWRGGGAVCFFTKYGAFASMPNSQGEKNTKIIGYSVVRKFYSPNYETHLPLELKDDFRNTLYWNPMIRTNSTGISKIDFYNSNQTGEVQVVVEGVSRDGKLCRGLCKYKVTR